MRLSWPDGVGEAVLCLKFVMDCIFASSVKLTVDQQLFELTTSMRNLKLTKIGKQAQSNFVSSRQCPLTFKSLAAATSKEQMLHFCLNKVYMNL